LLGVVTYPSQEKKEHNLDALSEQFNGVRAETISFLIYSPVRLGRLFNFEERDGQMDKGAKKRGVRGGSNRKPGMTEVNAGGSGKLHSAVLRAR